MGNQIRGGKMSDSSALANAIQLLDWLEFESVSLFLMMEDRNLLKLELRFLIMFLKYTADRCIDYKNWQHLLTQIQDVGQDINNLYWLLATRTEEHPWFEYILLLHKIELVKPEVGRVLLMNVSRLSGWGSRMSHELVLEFIDSLLEYLKLILGSVAPNLIQPSLKEGVKVLKRKLTSLKGLLNFTVRRCNDFDKLDQLFTLVQPRADTAAYLAYACQMIEMDGDIASRLALQLSDLVQSIDPIKPEVRGIYIGVLEASKSSESKSNTYEMDGTLVDLVDCLLENTLELLYHVNITMKDQIEMLYEELKSFRYLLEDAERLTKHGNTNDLLSKMEVLAIDVGCVIYSLFEDEVNREMRLALSKLLDNFKLVSEIYVGAKARVSNLPTTEVLRNLDLLLRDLKELLDASDDSFNLLKDKIHMVHRDMGFLGSFLTTTKKQRHEQKKLENLWRRIINVMYEVKHLIDLIVEHGPLLHHKPWLSYLIEEINLIKIEINEIQIFEKNISSLQEHNLRKRSSSLVLSQKGAPRVDEEMVGFKDEEEKLTEQLVWGSKQLQIVSIGGMAGLGKTFLAQKIYNNPKIKNRFYVHAWSSVSQVYQRRDLLINILCQVKEFTRGMSKMMTDEELAGELHRCLKGQKYLIVLDDMWDIGAWEALRRSFPDDNNESRIVFTSRSPELALKAKSNSKINRLRSFTDSESWELLKKKIFQLENCPPELHEVGKCIAKYCNGLPLAIVMVAGLLAGKIKELDKWKEVADGLSSHIINNPQRKCINILDLSYKSLPDYLRPCFLYLGRFPKDKEIPVKQLMWLWIAEGFVQDKEPNLEYIAEGYLMDLIGKSLVIASKERSTNGLKTCILHDLVREFCLAKAKEEKFLMRIEGGGHLPTWTSSESNAPTSPSTCYEQRRLLVHLREGKPNWSKSFGPYVRSLLFTIPWYMHFPTEELVSIIHRIKLLTVLDLVNVLLNPFPEAIELLVLLKYLAVRVLYRAVVPPKSIASLRNLETLFIVGGFGSRFGDVILNLTKLRHLCIGSLSFSHVSSIDESFQLDTLQTLSGLCLSDADNMEIMRRFPNLKRLSCTFEVLDSSSKCNWLPTLGFLSQLESLKVSYFGFGFMPLSQGFCLPSNIRKLTMSNFRLPWEQISIIAKLPKLEVLKLLFDAFEGEEWNMQEGEFQKLKVLKLGYLDIRKWIASCDYFPLLERLILEKCNRLEEIPPCLAEICTLKVIQVYGCNASLEGFIRWIQEEQIDIGNEELQIEIKR